MMATHRVTLELTLEQANAIKTLFGNHGLDYESVIAKSTHRVTLELTSGNEEAVKALFRRNNWDYSKDRPLLSREEVEDFAVQFKYFDYNSWPQQTTLLYKLSITYTYNYPVTTAVPYQHTEFVPHRGMCTSIRQQLNTTLKLTPPLKDLIQWCKVTDIDGGSHAEQVMLEEIKKKINEYIAKFNNVIISKLDVDIVLSYSPCSDTCAKELIDFKTSNLSLFSQNATIDMRILIANFYESYEATNLVALSNLHRAGITLEVFHGRLHWEHFLGTIVVLRDKEYDDCLSLATSRERREREEVDVRILEAVKICGEAMTGEDNSENNWDELGLKNIGKAKSMNEADRLLVLAKIKKKWVL